MKKIDGILSRMVCCTAAEATLKYQGVNTKEWITEKTWASVKEIAKIRKNYSIQNLNESVNESKRITTKIRMRKLRRMPHETRGLLLINWQKRQKWLPKYVIWVRSIR